MEVVYEFMNTHMKFLEGAVGTTIFWLGEATLLGCLIYGWRMYDRMEKEDELAEDME